ncbi:MAG: MarR family transcriptional regulator [Candidatus Thermoplasmatota archaeon]
MANTSLQQTAVASLEVGLAFLSFLRSEVRRATSANISMPEFRTLHLLAKNPDRSLGEIADDLGVSAPALSKTVHHLVQGGLVERKEDAADRRRIAVRLTPTGKRLMAQTRTQLETAMQGRLSKLAAKEREQILPALHRLQAVLAQEVAA